MSSKEEQLLVVPDVVLPADINTRYDIYFTDRRIAIVCMGPVDRYGYSIGKNAHVSRRFSRNHTAPKLC